MWWSSFTSARVDCGLHHPRLTTPRGQTFCHWQNTHQASLQNGQEVKPSEPSHFTALPAFDKAMKKIVAVTKEDVEKREKEPRTPRIK